MLSKEMLQLVIGDQGMRAPVYVYDQPTKDAPGRICRQFPLIIL
jgi:hypothetical protein